MATHKCCELTCNVQRVDYGIFHYCMESQWATCRTWIGRRVHHGAGHRNPDRPRAGGRGCDHCRRTWITTGYSTTAPWCCQEHAILPRSLGLSYLGGRPGTSVHWRPAHGFEEETGDRAQPRRGGFAAARVRRLASSGRTELATRCCYEDSGSAGEGLPQAISRRSIPGQQHSSQLRYRVYRSETPAKTTQTGAGQFTRDFRISSCP